VKKPAAELPDDASEPASRSGAIALAKNRLRSVARAHQESVESARLRAVSTRIAESVLELPEIEGAEGVLICLSFGPEVDTWDLTDRLLQSGRSVFVPRAEPRDRQLHVHPYPCQLRTLSFGLMQPPRGTHELVDSEIAQRVDVALVLGLAFDRRGYRLGHGSGYFDRFLSRHRVLAVGLTPADLLYQELPVSAHDLPMSIVVTEREVVRTVARASGDRHP